MKTIPQQTKSNSNYGKDFDENKVKELRKKRGLFARLLDNKRSKQISTVVIDCDEFQNDINASIENTNDENVENLAENQQEVR